MADLWSSLGADLRRPEGEWLVRRDGVVHGPLPHAEVVAQLVGGEIGPATEVAREATSFHPIGQVAAFATHLAAARTAAARRGRRRAWVTGALTALVLALGAGAGALRWRAALRLERAAAVAAAARAAAESAAATARAEAEARAAMPLVALVSLGTDRDVRIRAATPPSPAPAPGSGRPAAAHRRPKPLHRRANNATAGAGPAAAAEGAGGDDGEAGDALEVQGCGLTQQQIFATLQGALRGLNGCVADARHGEAAALLPPVLSLSFVVRPSGRAVDLVVDDPHFKTGALNNCLARVFGQMKFPESDGASCPVTIPIKIAP